MTLLSQKKCVPCQGGVPSLDSDTIQLLLKQLNQFQNEKNLAATTQAGVTFSQVSEANALANAGNTVTINNIYQTNGENCNKTEVTPNFSGPTDGHGSFLTAFSSLAIATL